MKITKNVLQSIYKITCGSISGTAFEISYKEKNYLITAGHCVVDPNIFVWHEGQNKKLEYNLIKKHQYADIAVIELKNKIHGELKIGNDSDYTMGDNIFFLGFPYGLAQDFSNINDGFVMPLVKGGIISGFNNGQIFIDAHNNPGFSGGPLLINIDNNFLVIGIISGYIPEKKELFTENSGIGYASKLSLIKEILDNK